MQYSILLGQELMLRGEEGEEFLRSDFFLFISFSFFLRRNSVNTHQISSKKGEMDAELDFCDWNVSLPSGARQVSVAMTKIHYSVTFWT